MGCKDIFLGESQKLNTELPYDDAAIPLLGYRQKTVQGPKERFALS